MESIKFSKELIKEEYVVNADGEKTFKTRTREIHCFPVGEDGKTGLRESVGRLIKYEGNIWKFESGRADYCLLSSGNLQEIADKIRSLL